MSDTLPIQCPACGAGYLLPTHLLGEQGARVRCPSCEHAFTVARDGSLQAPAPEPIGAPSAEPHDAASALAPPPSMATGEPDARAIAVDLLAALESLSPGTMQQAASEGRLFREFGPVLMQAYDEFRRRTATQSGSTAFRDELFARYGVDLFQRTTSR